MTRTLKHVATPRHGGFSLVELMVSLIIGLLILAALVALFVNSSKSNREMARANNLIENGRLAIELISSDAVHSGYWGGFIPTYDDQTFTGVPIDPPTAIPDPCLAFTTPWTPAHRQNLISVPLQVYDSDAVCNAIVTNKQATTDVLVVRHADTCVAGAAGCDAFSANRLYFQSTRCATDLTPWVLDTSAGTAFPLRLRNCTTQAERRRFISNIYYIRDFAVTAGDGIPTLMRSTFDFNGTTVAHQPAVAMVEGIQGFRVELGIDDRSEAYAGNPTGTPVNYAQAVAWLDPNTRTTPTNRGDGAPDGAFVSCTTATPCTLGQLMNATAVKIHVLVRSREATPGYTDTKTYQLGPTAMGPFNDGFKRHVYTYTLRLPNISGRRQTP